jgi:hypothetical protein
MDVCHSIPSSPFSLSDTGYINNRLFAHNLTRRNVKQIKRIKSNQIEKEEKGDGQ